MRHSVRRLDEQAFERLCEHMAVAIVHCSDQQVLDLADSLHASLRRRRDTKAVVRLDDEQRSWMV